MLTLGAAAKLTGLNRTTVLRAIKSGRLSAARQDDGSYRIDPAELERVYTIRQMPDALGVQRADDDDARRSAQVGAAGDAHQYAHRANQPLPDARIAALEAEVRGLQALLTEVRASRELAHEQNRGLQEQNRILLAALPPPRRPWWR